MKNIILIVCSLSLVMSACKKEEEYVSYILAVEQHNFGTNDLNIDAILIGPRVKIDSFFVNVKKITPTPQSDTVYKFEGTRRSGKHHFSIHNLITNATYYYYISGTTWDGEHSRYVRTRDTMGTTFTP